MRTPCHQSRRIEGAAPLSTQDGGLRLLCRDLGRLRVSGSGIREDEDRLGALPDDELCRELRRLHVSAALRDEHKDRLGALPDDVLGLVLRRLDTRSALATAALSRRWARLPHELPVLEFKVSDVLPERYREYLRRHLHAADRPKTRLSSQKIKNIDLVLARYERRGMRSLADSLGAFLEEPVRRRVRKVILEIFPTHNTGSLDRLITTAIGDWGAEELEIVVLNPHGSQGLGAAGYSFPHRSFDIRFHEGACEVSLRRLKLSNCAPHVFGLGANPSVAPARAFSALAVLVLQDMPSTTRGRVYGSVIRACPALEILHLKSCGCRGRSLTVDAADSRITEMVVELTGRILGKIDLRSLPRLERLACMGAPLEFKLGVVPRLAHLNLTYDEDTNRWTPLFEMMGVRNLYPLSSFIGGLTVLEDLVLRFTGPEMWVLRPSHDMPPLGKLRRLLVADMPPSWDMTWTRYLLEAAPFLETLHVHIADNDYVGSVAGRPIWWPPSTEFRHRRLGEVVIGGFEGTPRQMHFVRFIKQTCTALREVVLIRHGVVRDKGLYDWEKVAPRHDWQWSEEDIDSVLRDIDDGTCAAACSTTQIVFR